MPCVKLSSLERIMMGIDRQLIFLSSWRRKLSRHLMTKCILEQGGDAILAVASKINLNSGGKVPLMRKTTFVEASPGTEITQSMINDKGVPKGLKQVLFERELWIQKVPKD